MTNIQNDAPLLTQRTKRADARRNYEKLVDAARDAFATEGTAASLEDIARRAGVGIGTLYRHFPSRQHLLEAVYLEEVEAICRSVEDFSELEPWEALSGWLHRFVGFAATKRALAEQLFEYIDRDSEVFRSCGDAINAAGGPLLERAQEAGVVRPDTNFIDVARMVGGISVIHTVDDEQIGRVLRVALDGLRYRPAPDG
jgi:AcrR family transcriptional regulator